MRNGLGNLEPFVSAGPAFGEQTELGMVPGKLRTGVHGGQEHLAQALVALYAFEGRHGALQAGDRLAIVALGTVSLAEALIRQCV